MKRKLFKVIFAVTAGLCVLMSAVFYAAGKISVFYIAVIGIAVAALLSFVAAMLLSDTISRNINTINIKDPNEKETYREIRPLVRRIAEQNAQLFGRMDVLKEEHKKQDSMRREFTANVSHELKTPLTSISGYAELMENSLAKPEDIPVFAARIHTEADRMLSLVEDILRLSRLDEGEIIRETENVNLYNEAQIAAEELCDIAKKRNVEILVFGEEVSISNNRKMIFEIIRNLCDNAVKYNLDGGKVEITVGLNAAKQPFVSVKDTGIGIPKEEQERIFERFYRVDKSRSKAAGGTGLGLSIVKHSALKLGAEITLKSEVSQGTEITVTF